MATRRKFIRQIGLATVSIGVLPQMYSCVSKMNTVTKTGMLPRSTPEAQGVSTAAINKFFDAMELSKQEFHGTMILKNGHVIAEGWWEPYGPNHKMQLYSMSKSFTSSAIGFAQQEGLLNVEDQVIQYFQDDLPTEISPNLEALKIKHLLMMSVGHVNDSILTIEHSPEGVAWSKTFLEIPVVFEPGTKFLYNSGASFMLANIVQKVTGMTAHDFLKPRLFKPLGIKDTTWSTSPEGINFGASHLRLDTEDMAKFGQFWLQGGIWNGEQILNKEYIAAASSKQISNGNNDHSWGYGYGYQFWLNPPGGYRADGAYGQYSMIFPKQNSVVAIASESMNSGETMNMVWDILYPELGATESIPENTSAVVQMKKRLSELTCLPEQFVSKSLNESKYDSKLYTIEENPLDVESMTFEFQDNTISFQIKEKGRAAYSIRCGRNNWIKGGNYKPAPHSLFSKRRIDFDSIVAGAAGWENESTLRISLRLIETCHTEYLTCVFNADKLSIKMLFSVQKTKGEEDSRKELIGEFS